MEPTVELGIDGFPLDPNDPDIRYHRELSTWLEIDKSQGVPAGLRFDPAEEWSRWLRPAVRRFAWVKAHALLLSGERKLDFRLAHLISHLINRLGETGPMAEDSLAELASQAAAIDASGAGSMFRADTARLLLAAMKRGIGSETRQQIHAMLNALSVEDRFGGMHELAWRLFLDEIDSGDAAPCWSASVRRDLRSMKPAARKPWTAVLKLAPTRLAPPDAKWQEKARKAIERIGREEWEDWAAGWLAQASGASNTGRAGQILLRLIDEASKALEAEPKPAPESAEIIELLRKESYAGFEEAVAYTKKHGYKSDIVEAVRKYHGTLHGSVTDQARRQHVGWWLWLEDVTPIDADECWSSIVRADLRGFTGDRKRAWMDLISNVTFAIGSRMPAKWAKASEAALKAVGDEDFRARMRRWLAPTAPGGSEDKPLRLSVAGRDALRCLIWDCLFCAPDPELDQALLEIGRTKWKNKESRDRALKLEGPLAEVLGTRNPELARQLSAERVETPAPPPQQFDPQAAMQKAMEKALSIMPLGDRIEMHPDHILVRGERDHYRIGMDGVITRRSGSRVRINMDALPSYLSQLAQPMIDAIDLQQGMFQPNRMRLITLATILAHDAQWEAAIE